MKYILPNGMKRCPAPLHEGNRVLPVTEFHKNRSCSDGYQRWCKVCLRRKMNTYRRTSSGYVLRRNDEQPTTPIKG